MQSILKPLRLLVGAAAILALAPAAAMSAPPPPRDPLPGPSLVRQTVVSVGDSAISGEAGRWAGNTKGNTVNADALGPTAYFDNASGTGELVPGCHRSKSAEVHIGGGVRGVNLACSGSKTGTYIEGSTGHFKPGIDFWNVGHHKGQAQLLQEYATANPRSIKAVVVLIGANDYGFAEVADTCAKRWLQTLNQPWWPDLCQDDANLTTMFSSANVTTVISRISDAFLNVRTAMSNAGYADEDYRIIAQTYSSPIPTGGGFRYNERDFINRYVKGGCPIQDIDATWVEGTAVSVFNGSIRQAVARSGLTNVDLLEARNLFAGRKLCERGAGLLEEAGVANWQDPRAADATEWVKQINQLDERHPDYQENAHPNYWGQMALRNCLRQAYNNGAVRGGTCARNGQLGLNSRGEPNVTLQ